MWQHNQPLDWNYNETLSGTGELIPLVLKAAKQTTQAIRTVVALRS